MILLEYNEQTGFHNNYYVSEEKRFGDKLFAYGWKPVCLISDELAHKEEFENLTNDIEERRCSYEEVVEEVALWIANKLEPLDCAR